MSVARFNGRSANVKGEFYNGALVGINNIVILAGNNIEALKRVGVYVNIRGIELAQDI